MTEGRRGVRGGKVRGGWNEWRGGGRGRRGVKGGTREGRWGE